MGNARYMFVDGAFFHGQVASARKCFELGDDVDIDYPKFRSNVDRVFYYDSFPVRKPNQSEHEHISEYTKVEALFKKIGSTRNWHVKTGLSRYQKRKRGTEQKAVDILLALDVYRHAMLGNMDTAIIVTSDLDFAPVFEALLDTKVRSELWFDPKKTSELLIDAADYAVPFNEYNVIISMPNDISARYSVSIGNRSKEEFAGKIKISEISDGDWHFIVYKEFNKYFGMMEGRPDFCIESSDFRSVRIFAEGHYRVDLTKLTTPKILQL